MKIGINASFSRKPGTGIGQVTIHFLNSLFEEKEFLSKHQLFIYSEEELPQEIRLPEGVSFRSFLPLWKRDDLIRKIWWEKYSLPKMARKDGCQAFFSLYQSPTVFPENIRHLMLIHDIIPRLFPEYLDNFRKRTYQNLVESAAQKADHIISISKKTEKDLIQHLKIPGERITTAYIDVDPNYHDAPSGSEIQRVLKKYRLKPGYILGGAGLDRRKNIGRLILSYKKLADDNKKEGFLPELPTLAIVGKLQPELSPLITDVEAIIRKEKLGKKVRAIGFVPQKDLKVLYSEAIFFVYPSLYEGFGLPVLEAMNQGTPVLTSKTSSLPEVGRDGVLYCDPEDEEEISHILKNLIRNKDLRESLSRKGRERSQDFSWKTFVRKTTNILSEWT